MRAAVVRESHLPRVRSDPFGGTARGYVWLEEVAMSRIETGYLDLLEQLAAGEHAHGICDLLACLRGLTRADRADVRLHEARSGRAVYEAADGSGTVELSRHVVVVHTRPHAPLTGTLCVAFDNRRGPSAANVRRTERLGAALMLHLAHTHDRLVERELRETFVSQVAHDLRGPLALAKAAASMIDREAIPRHEGLRHIDRGIRDASRMVHHLLDAHLVRTGAPLPLRLVQCDLMQVVAEVIEELVPVHGARFLLDGEGPVAGAWSADHLERAVWNLATNAVQYGAPGAPIRIRVARTESGVEIAVHNRRSALGQRSRGWGLGLALVAAAAEAHAGSLDEEGSPEEGTTFTIRLPHAPAHDDRARAA